MLSTRSFMLLFLSCIAVRMNLCFTGIHSSLKMLSINGHFEFDKVQFAARDFGNRYQYYPAAVLHPSSVSDIAMTIEHIWKMGPRSELTVAARGHGHSLHGQAQAHQGVVINMESLQDPQMQVHTRNFTYVDVSGGELWINILHESLKYGLTPKSWTDYLHLTVGGTLSNAGISGQAFRHGPQISNVHQLEVVTGSLPYTLYYTFARVCLWLLVAFLTSAVPFSRGNNSLEYILAQNMRILEFCRTANLGAKQYLPHYTTRNEWQAHFGPMWETYVQRKKAYDPLAILAPGQRIFQKAKSLS